MSGPEPVAAWSQRTACCEECGEIVGVGESACSNCGQRPDAHHLDVVGFVTERDGQAWLSQVQNYGHGWLVRGQRPVTAEQVAALRRQGDVR